MQQLPMRLFGAAWVQLATIYEVYLAELIGEALRDNLELISIEEKQLTTAEIFALGDFGKIRERLIDRWVFKFGMGSYPVKVDRLQSKFHIGIHSDRAPIEIFDVHDFVEVRNVLSHSDGHASSEYHERMSGYGRQTLLRGRYASPTVDFRWLMGFSERLAELCDFIELEMSDRWDISSRAA